MRANFYLHADSLKMEPSGDKAAYINNFQSFIKDVAFILDDTVEENKLIISISLYDDTRFDGEDIYQFAQRHLKRDGYALLCQILNRGELKDDFELSEIEPLTLFSKDERECHIIVKIFDSSNKVVDYTKYIEFATYELVYDRNSWLTVRRQILGNHPENATEFMRRAKAYFPDLVFSECCEERISPFLTQIPRKIVYHLSCMNDHLAEFWEKHPHPSSLNLVCADFSGKFGFDKAGSQQGNPDKEDYLSFVFANKEKAIFCSAHFKITSCDSNSTDPAARDPNYNARIYFSCKNHEVFVGSIGPHVE